MILYVNGKEVEVIGFDEYERDFEKNVDPGKKRCAVSVLVYEIEDGIKHNVVKGEGYTFYGGDYGFRFICLEEDEMYILKYEGMEISESKAWSLFSDE